MIVRTDRQFPHAARKQRVTGRAQTAALLSIPHPWRQEILAMESLRLTMVRMELETRVRP
ncbi:MAG: hypothetical protein GWP07_02005 [Xanthomonadaceae bacterium]|nr:hypothetical protein [Xanthomonadaceae bacterium]